MNQPARVRVTGPPRRRAGTRPLPTREIDDDTELGQLYMRSLLREQLRLALGILVLLGLTLGLLPLAYYVVPSLARLSVGPVPLSWVLLGGLAAVGLLLLG